MGDFVHLHLHTEYSLLDGATRISTIADKALSDGQTAVAITDHGVMYGAVEFYNAMKEKGIKPIIGCEVYVAPRGRHMKEGKIDISGTHLVLLCKNEIGYKNLCYMVSESFINGFYSKPRIDMTLLREHHDGLIALSGCVGGYIPQLILAGSMSDAEAYAIEMKSIFGDDFYLEIQNHGMDDERRVAYGLKILSEKCGIPLVATNDVHYLEKSDAEIQATLMCIQTNNVITDGRPFGFETDEYYFKTADEMKKMFASFENAVENTVKIAEKCNFDFTFNELYLPDFEPEGGLTHKEQLRIDTYKGFEERANNGRFDFSKNTRGAYVDRIEYELSVIDKMGFNAYFLIVSDFIAFAKNNDIPVGPGRGSGAGSLVAFCIGITDVDPIEFDLLFERFLNPERVSMPDFDVDFCYIRREEVIEYVKRKYGEEKVAQIVTFGTLAPRMAVRDVGRALGLPYNKVDTVAKMIPVDAGSIDDALSNKDLRKEYIEDSEIRNLIDVSRGVEGMPRHASTHAAGVVITKNPTWEYVPLSYSGTGVVTQFDMNVDASLGLVKFDFLGLRYITVIHDAEKMIRKRIPDFDISRVPFDDSKTYKLLCDSRTDGVFQLESGGMKAVLSKLAPSCFEDIIACIALFRPGPMDSIDKFIARKHGQESVEYKIPQLKEILDVTYGCIVYQEQVMQICRELAGYSYARADIVRRAMSKKKESAMNAERAAFIEGCIANSIGENSAREIFEEMVGFAKYAFNKSHATVYGVTSYRTAYLKAHYPAEYFAALLSSVLDNPKKLKEYIADAQKFGVSVLPPDINLSEIDFSVTDGNIRFGLLAIKNVGKNFANSIIKTRQNGKFDKFDKFITRMPTSELNKRTVESLIKCGVFDSLGHTRNSLLNCFEGIMDAELESKHSNVAGQFDLFSMGFGGGNEFKAPEYEYPDYPEYALKELLILEKESSGMYFSGHMIDDYSRHVEKLSVDEISDILNDFSDDASSKSKKYFDKSEVKIAGIITNKRTKATKNGSTMAFITVEDKLGEIEIVVFSRQNILFDQILYQDNAVCIVGSISAEEGEEPKILLAKAEALISNRDMPEDIRTYDQKEVGNRNIYIRVANQKDERIPLIYRISALNRGNTQVVIFDDSTRKCLAMKNICLDPTDKVVNKLKDIFGMDNVVIK